LKLILGSSLKSSKKFCSILPHELTLNSQVLEELSFEEKLLQEEFEANPWKLT